MSARPAVAVRAIVALFALALLATTFADSAAPAAAADLTDRISNARSGQLYSERLMRQQDRVLAKIGRERTRTVRKVKRTTRIIKRTNKRYKAATRILRIRVDRLNQAEARYPDPSQAPDPENWSAKIKAMRRDVSKAEDQRRGLGNRLRITARTRNARQRQLRALRRKRDAAAVRRDAAEGALAARIVQMTSLAQQRSARQTDVRLTDSGDTFAWPSPGVITQPFGCTGFRLNPSRGSCRHFHDGIDMVSGYGSAVRAAAVRAAAVGVVAYVGWNPWDVRERAFIVVVGHSGGYVTRYGHLVPSRKVRAGQLVRKGQIIGKMGNTGNSTGTHLHMELLQYTTPLDPVAYLPGGVVEIRQSKDPDRKKSKKSRKSKQRSRSKAAGSSNKNSRAGDRRDRPSRSGNRDASESLTLATDGASTFCRVLPETFYGRYGIPNEPDPWGASGPFDSLTTASRAFPPVKNQSCGDDDAAVETDLEHELVPVVVVKTAPIPQALIPAPQPRAPGLTTRGTSPIPE